MENKLRLLPGVDRLLNEGKIKKLTEIFPHDLVVDMIRENLECCRTLISQGKETPSLSEIVENIYHQGRLWPDPVLDRSSMPPVLSCTPTWDALPSAKPPLPR